ncbi:MAG: ribonuclease III [Propionicimonas sp.]|uniref:ribonuclease III n=1 Tax=Propionicimonas sp. TaxID=1955623 RepID=UPI002B1F7AA5|nr:ribonuclease III [Propionicimonas sp.]MEA4944318.1 ribonuclease III [Propionicimonas sp.]MEA5055888.1 ribonuclease III [Propionicimonas sp.]MEA5118641.1 ribonuclease III [Propionicimonas sp.]
MSRARQLFDELGIDIDPELYQLALTHRSYSYENGVIPHNERLEFLGDSVLGVVVTEYLYRTFPDLPEGRLAKLRAAVVNAQALAGVARDLDLGSELLLGRGEISTGGANKASILADSLEAVFGAVLISAGRDGADKLLHHLFDPLVDKAATVGAGLDWKTSLQEICARLELGLPSYRLTETGPDHDKRFTAVAVVGEESFGAGHGRSKKQAEQQAAEAAFGALTARRDQDAPAAD